LKPGKNLLLAFGNMVQDCLRAADRLEEEGISLAVVNARFARPLDRELILSYAQSDRLIITAEEGVTAGGFGSAVRELLDEEACDGIRFMQIGLPVEIYPVGKVEQIKRMYRLDVEGLIDRIKAFWAKGEKTGGS
ncbi:MAG: 1-deoxy-D-xylulose-5-phosphate synthase, partial [Acidobacteria bacterium]|nr:1-deoxy-D-xylulose-5-phosphate synthase [Acidobacteriota bacterium]